MKRDIYSIDEHGFIIERYKGEFNINDELIYPLGNFITKELPNPLFFHKPRWFDNEWIEGATQEEIDEITKVEMIPPSQIEILTEQVQLQQSLIDDLLFELIPSLLRVEEVN